MKDFLGQEHVYDLLCVNTHISEVTISTGNTISKGHYTAEVLKDDCWWRFDDNQIPQKINSPFHKNISKHTPYVLYYRRRGEPILQSPRIVEECHSTIKDVQVNSIEEQEISDKEISKGTVYTRYFVYYFTNYFQSQLLR